MNQRLASCCSQPSLKKCFSLNVPESKSSGMMSDNQANGSEDQQRWSLVKQRKRCEPASFVYAVKTTGIYCRPGCSSRLPRRENVEFYDDIRQARAAGFRPCKRCRPDADDPQQATAEPIQAACKLIEEAEEPLSLEQLSAAVNYSPTYFQRLFRQTVGVTPKAYAAMQRANRVRTRLLDDSSVTGAVYASGYGTMSRFYDESDEVLGMKPSQYRRGGKGVAIHAAVVPTSLGPILIAATDKGLCAIEFGDDEQQMLNQLRERFSDAEIDESKQFSRWVSEVVSFIDAPGERLSLPLDIQGTAFQRRVWEMLCKVPRGTTTTYAEIATRIGKPNAARAVAGACAANRIAVAIPCHRVIRGDGKIGGYRWGAARKEALLAKEVSSSKDSTK